MNRTSFSVAALDGSCGLNTVRSSLLYYSASIGPSAQQTTWSHIRQLEAEERVDLDQILDLPFSSLPFEPVENASPPLSLTLAQKIEIGKNIEGGENATEESEIELSEILCLFLWEGGLVGRTWRKIRNPKIEEEESGRAFGWLQG